MAALGMGMTAAMGRTITINLRDDVDAGEYARIANLVWAVATHWQEVESVNVDRDHERCDEVYDAEYCHDAPSWRGGRRNRSTA